MTVKLCSYQINSSQLGMPTNTDCSARSRKTANMSYMDVFPSSSLQHPADTVNANCRSSLSDRRELFWVSHCRCLYLEPVSKLCWLASVCLFPRRGNSPVHRSYNISLQSISKCPSTSIRHCITWSSVSNHSCSYPSGPGRPVKYSPDVVVDCIWRCRRFKHHRC